jgi:hypothetical protein
MVQPPVQPALSGAAGPVQYFSQIRFGLKKNGLLLRSGAGEGSNDVSVTVLNTVLFAVVVVTIVINLVSMLVAKLVAILVMVLITVLLTALFKGSGQYVGFGQGGWLIGGGWQLIEFNETRRKSALCWSSILATVQRNSNATSVSAYDE